MTDKTDMTELLKHMRALINMGCAVVIFTPEELRGADPDEVQSRMIEVGSECIDWLADKEA